MALAPNRPFTLVVCGAGCHGPSSSAVMAHLREAVRGCPHGVLVTTGCLATVLHCDTEGPYGAGVRGPFAVVQPCDTRRNPVAAPTRLGPITCPDDASAIGAWLRAGLPDDGSLPAPLRATPPLRSVAPLN